MATSAKYGLDIRQFMIKPRSKVVEEMKAQRRSAVAAVEDEMDSLLTRLDVPRRPKAPPANSVLSDDDESDDELVFKSPPPPAREQQHGQAPQAIRTEQRPAAELFEQTFEQELAVAEIGTTNVAPPTPAVRAVVTSLPHRPAPTRQLVVQV